MKALVLGLGLQGKAVVHDLEQSHLVDKIIAADLNLETLRESILRAGFKKTEPVRLDAAKTDDLAALIKSSEADIVICMLPPDFGYPVARACLDCGRPFVSSSYTGRVAELDEEARARGIVILPEMGMDPGIDLVLARLAISGLDRVVGLYSYGAGLPEPEAAATNPLGYKITWRFDGVLSAYRRPARYLEDGRVRSLDGEEIFGPDQIHSIEVDGLGPLQAYRNGDALHYIPAFGLSTDHLRYMGRFAMRYPGHAEFWYKLVKLGFTDDEPVPVDGAAVSPRRFLVDFLTPKLQFGEKERDVAIIRVVAWGYRNGEPRTVTYELIDYRDLDTGLFAMNRTVGFTTSIGAQMVLSGAVAKPGVLSPIHDVDPQALIENLRERGMTLRRWEKETLER